MGVQLHLSKISDFSGNLNEFLVMPDWIVFCSELDLHENRQISLMIFYINWQMQNAKGIGNN